MICSNFVTPIELADIVRNDKSDSLKRVKQMLGIFMNDNALNHATTCVGFNLSVKKINWLLNLRNYWRCSKRRKTYLLEKLQNVI